MKLNAQRVMMLLWSILVFMIIGFPRILQTPKIIICILIILCFLANKRVLKLHQPTLGFLIPWIIYVVLSIAIGLINNNLEAGIIAFIRVNVINVLLYVVLISTVEDKDIIDSIIKGVVYSIFYVSVYNIILIICGYIGINIPFLYSLDATADVGLHVGYTHIVSTNLSMSIMAFPLLLLMRDSHEIKRIINTKILVAVIMLCAISMVLSGRRILWLALGIALICYLMFRTANPLKKLKYILVVTFVVIIGITIADRTGLFSVSGLIERFQYAFAAYDEYGIANVRDIQSIYLLEEFKKSPIIGKGAGAVISGFQRNSASPWAFELSYHVVLFQSGIIGAIFYFIALWEILKNILLSRRFDIYIGRALLVTYIIVLVANATNPYFSSSFDLMIFMFLPLLLSEALTQGYIGNYLQQDPIK